MVVNKYKTISYTCGSDLCLGHLWLETYVPNTYSSQTPMAGDLCLKTPMVGALCLRPLCFGPYDWKPMFQTPMYVVSNYAWN